MRITILTLLLSLASNYCISQSDTSYLNDNFIEINGKKYNYLENEIKSGNWIEFKLPNKTTIMRMGSGFMQHTHEKVAIEYRHLNQGEYNGIEILQSTKTDTTNIGIIISSDFLKIENRIPPDKYFITGKGNYKNNLKDGKWIYFHENGKIKTKITYKNGLPIKGYKVFRNDGKLMIETKRIDKANWKICKYDDNGKLIVCENKKLNEFELIY